MSLLDFAVPPHVYNALTAQIQFNLFKKYIQYSLFCKTCVFLGMLSCVWILFYLCYMDMDSGWTTFAFFISIYSFLTWYWVFPAIWELNHEGSYYAWIEEYNKVIQEEFSLTDSLTAHY